MPRSLIFVYKCGRCGEGMVEMMQHLELYHVECELCEQHGPKENSTEKAVTAWNTQQRSTVHLKGNDHVH